MVAEMFVAEVVVVEVEILVGAAEVVAEGDILAAKHDMAEPV